MRSGRLLVRAAAVSALLVATLVAVVLLSHAGGSGLQSSAKHAGTPAKVSSGAPGTLAAAAVTPRPKAHVAAASAIEKAAASRAAATKLAAAKAAATKLAAAKAAAKLKTHLLALPAPKTIPIAVLNGGRSQGAAATLAAHLRSLGYPVPVVGNAGRRDLPMAIEYSAGLGPAARALARQVGSVRYVTPLEGPNRNLSGARLLVIIGN